MKLRRRGRALSRRYGSVIGRLLGSGGRLTAKGKHAVATEVVA
jgi:hypothetical protein